MYDKLSGKWVLKSVVVVEDAIYNEAKDYSVEHPLYSYVLHVNDSKLTDMFKPEEIKEIEEESGKADLMKALPESLSNMLMNLDGKNEFDSIDKAFQVISCNRRQQPEEYWCRESVLNYLNLFIDKDSVSSFPTEQDLLQDIYGFIKEIDDESSSDEMDLEYAAKEYGEVIMLADAFTTTIDDNDTINNEIIMKDSLATVSEKKAPSIKYKKYGKDQVKRFFELMTEEGYTVPKAAEIAGIPRSTAYELKKVWNDSDGSVYPKGCVKRESKKNPDKLKGNTKLEDKHAFFLIELIDKNPNITVMEAKEDLFSKFSDLLITASGVNKHMKGKCGLSLKESKLYTLTRDAPRTLKLRFEIITQ
ncbi:hypothetical protein G6F61_010750 [Rhizopus arrhizus]|nr:hypothetical protein G6F61_010750 [Rhizopus arrhizus]